MGHRRYILPPHFLIQVSFCPEYPRGVRDQEVSFPAGTTSEPSLGGPRECHQLSPPGGQHQGGPEPLWGRNCHPVRGHGEGEISHGCCKYHLGDRGYRDMSWGKEGDHTFGNEKPAIVTIFSFGNKGFHLKILGDGLPSFRLALEVNPA